MQKKRILTRKVTQIKISKNTFIQTLAGCMKKPKFLIM